VEELWGLCRMIRGGRLLSWRGRVAKQTVGELEKVKGGAGSCISATFVHGTGYRSTTRLSQLMY
jgi:hypothetical protein